MRSASTRQTGHLRQAADRNRVDPEWTAIAVSSPADRAKGHGFCPADQAGASNSRTV